MKIVVNGEEHHLNEPVSVEGLLDFLDIAQRKGVAIAVNMSVVPKTRWTEVVLNDGDEVELVRATQGG